MITETDAVFKTIAHYLVACQEIVNNMRSQYTVILAGEESYYQGLAKGLEQTLTFVTEYHEQLKGLMNYDGS